MIPHYSCITYNENCCCACIWGRNKLNGIELNRIELTYFPGFWSKERGLQDKHHHHWYRRKRQTAPDHSIWTNSNPYGNIGRAEECQGEQGGYSILQSWNNYIHQLSHLWTWRGIWLYCRNQNGAKSSKLRVKPPVSFRDSLKRFGFWSTWFVFGLSMLVISWDLTIIFSWLSTVVSRLRSCPTTCWSISPTEEIW